MNLLLCRIALAAGPVCLALSSLTITASAEPPAAIAPAAATAQPAVNPKVRALLVGVSHYDHMVELSLAGPANDVPLLAQTLRERFGLGTASTLLLTEAEGKKNPQRRPTLANIRRAFGELTKAINAGDQVVVYLSGHGVQETANDPGEVDGLDEIFLPADTQRPPPGEEHMLNSLPDNEIREALQAIAAKDAYIWFIADCCHSGTIARGLDIPRRIAPFKLFSPEVTQKVEDLQSQYVPATTRPAGRMPKNTVALFACRSREVTFERLFPNTTWTRSLDTYGLLTYSLVRVLQSHRQAEPLTYREAWQRLQQEYEYWGVGSFPVPLLEGVGRDRTVLGEKARPQAERFDLFQAETGWKLRAGLLHGITQDSVLSVFAPVGAANAGQRVGHVVVKALSALEAEVAPCEFTEGGKTWPSPTTLPKKGQCELAYFNYGDLRPTVAADDPIGGGPDRKTLQAMLNDIASRPEVPLRVLDDPKAAQWRVLAEKSQVYLSPSQGDLVRDRDWEARLKLLRMDALPEDLTNHLRKIARAEVLRKLAKEPPFTESKQAQLSLDLLKYPDVEDQVGAAVALDGERPRLAEGEIIAFRVTNASPRTKLYVTVLMIDSAYDIFVLYPSPGELVEELSPQASFTTDKFRVNIETVGAESIIAIAAQASGPPVDFTSLAKSTLPGAKAVQSTRGPTEAGSNLSHLLQGYLFNDTSPRAIRGVDRVEMQRCAISLLNWETVPEPPAK